jgi:maltose phosphorylase
VKNYFEKNEWEIIENKLHSDDNRLCESVMSLGNGYMGMRGNFEEQYSGDSLRGSYVAGVYYPDKTRVGWWKNGYPEYFAKVLNSTNYIGINVLIDDKTIDLAKADIKSFHRTLDMKNGVLFRNFVIADSEGNEFEFEVKRFLSLNRKELAVIEYSIKPLTKDSKITFTPFLDGDVSNEDSNYDEKFWEEIDRGAEAGKAHLTMKTKKLDFCVAWSMKYEIKYSNEKQSNLLDLSVESKSKYVSNTIQIQAKKEQKITLYKYIAVTNNRYLNNDEILSTGAKLLEDAYATGFETLLSEHESAWQQHWRESDIVIDGDISAQQAIRYNIFQLNQTYTGEDPRLNIGPKGLTGEKYGGSTYWDTEAYCIPFYLSTQKSEIARNLLVYRYNQLGKAKENAQKLGLEGAFYPMVTMNGEECHNEWEITFEEIHRNAAISYAIYNYVKYTGDEKYLGEHGFEVLVETSRFWASRVHYNRFKDKYMIHGVTGPNEYENNVNNNWYTNTMAVWNLRYTLKVAELLEGEYHDVYGKLMQKLQLDQQEFEKWKIIINKMHFPYVKELEVFEQQDGYMDKEQILVRDLPKENLPLNQKWSWDRILRSCFIKQADVLQGLYFLNDEYDLETKRRNFDFYEPRTVHESSLSPCIYSIIAAEVGYRDKAYELYLRTARLDLDNYNNDTDDGLHITSMAGTWMSITHGFGGLRIKDNKLTFSPFAPKSWNKFSFKILFREHLLKVTVGADRVIVEQESGNEITIVVYGKEYTILQNGSIQINK